MNPTADVEQLRRHHINVLRQLHTAQVSLLELSTAATMWHTGRVYDALANSYQQMADDLVTSDTDSYSGGGD